MAEVEGTGEGTTGATTGQVETPAWAAQLPTDLKANPTWTQYKTVGDLGKTHLDLLGKVKDLEGKTAKMTELEGRLQNSVPKLKPDATKEEVQAFFSALRPVKAEEYDFPKGEGIDHDPKMIEWARETFFNAGLSKQQASIISEQWNSFISEFNKKLVQQEQDDLKAETEKFKQELGKEYDKNMELAKRFFKKLMGEDLTDQTPINPVTLLKILVKGGRMLGEDFSPAGTQSGGSVGQTGMIYDKTPQHMKR